MDTPMSHLNAMDHTVIWSSPECELRLYAAGFYLVVTPGGEAAITSMLFGRKQAERLYEQHRRARGGKTRDHGTS